jgi:uncharacterized protein
MRLDIPKALKSPGQSFGYTVSEDFEPICVAGEEIRFVKPVQIHATAVFTGEDFFLRGSIHAEYSALCCRCLKEVPSAMDVSFTEEFAKEADESHPDRYLYRGESLDLGQMVEDLISLNAPMRHLCSEGCKGLCPVCGADRNITDCSCPRPEPREVSE